VVLAEQSLAVGFVVVPESVADGTLEFHTCDPLCGRPGALDGRLLGPCGADLHRRPERRPGDQSVAVTEAERVRVGFLGDGRADRVGRRPVGHRECPGVQRVVPREAGLDGAGGRRGVQRGSRLDAVGGPVDDDGHRLLDGPDQFRPALAQFLVGRLPARGVGRP